MKELEDFCKKNRAKSERSKLFPFKAEIFELAKLDYSTYQITEFVNSKLLKNEKVHQKTVHNFLKKHYKKQNKKESTSYAQPSQTPVTKPIRQKKKVEQGAEMGYHQAARENENKQEEKSDAELFAEMTPEIKEGSQLDLARKALKKAQKIEKEKQNE